MVNYCGRFIPDLATISEPLRCLTKAGTPFVFEKEQKVFVELKKGLLNSETLGYFDKNAPMQIIANGRLVGLGAVSTQMNKDGPRIISYASPSLTSTKTRYSQRKRCSQVHMGLRKVPPLQFRAHNRPQANPGDLRPKI